MFGAPRDAGAYLVVRDCSNRRRLTQQFAEQEPQFAEGDIRMKNKEGTLSTGA